jgi:guanosine-3',5'-bis(diphosphate) 3'-pyrophosphohydrolase
MPNTENISTYHLSEEEEKKEILREYRGLLKVLKQKMKPGDKELVRSAFKMMRMANKSYTSSKETPFFFIFVQMECMLLGLP